MKDFWIRLTGATKSSFEIKHASVVENFEAEMPESYEWTSNNKRHRIATKAQIVAWASGEETFHVTTAGVREQVQPRFFTWNYGLVEAKPRYHEGRVKIASNGWMETAADDTSLDNIVNLPLPSHDS